MHLPTALAIVFLGLLCWGCSATNDESVGVLESTDVDPYENTIFPGLNGNEGGGQGNPVEGGGQTGPEDAETTPVDDTTSQGDGVAVEDGGEIPDDDIEEEEGTCPIPPLACVDPAICSGGGGIEEEEFTCGGSEICCNLNPPDVAVPGEDCDTNTPVSCGEDGSLLQCINGAWEASSCDEGSVCCDGACEPQVCTPYTEKECTSGKNIATCNECGTEMVEQPCPGTYYCDPVSVQCQCEVPVKILFLLDASGSMELNQVGTKTRWEVAQETIDSVMSDYPHFRYGLMTFPDTMVTCDGPGCAGEGGCTPAFTDELNAPMDTTPANITSYLSNRTLAGPGGDLELVLTPLHGAFEYLVEDYEGPLKDQDGTPAYVVVISDGQDTCHAPFYPELTVGPLGNLARGLADNWGIQTYPIGFGLEEGSNQLNALAQQGGTGLAEHLEADDLSSLSQVLVSVLHGVNPKTCEAIEAPAPVPPDCLQIGETDVDQDYWCSDLDCEDGSGNINPGSNEVSNGLDEDCDGTTDEPADFIPAPPGGDGAGCQGVDFLFIIDNSGSMGDEQENLINSFPGFISTIQNTLSTQDYQVMVVDSDSSGFGGGSSSMSCQTINGDTQCKCFPAPDCCDTVCADHGPLAQCNNSPACNQPPAPELDICDNALGGGRVFSDTFKECFTSPPRYMTSATPGLDASFACAASVGTGGDGAEKVMEAMVNAVTPPLMAPAGCNEGFIRDDAILVVTFITDENDAGSAGIPASWKSELVAAKGGQEDGIFVLGIFGDPDKPNSVCDNVFGGPADAAPLLDEFLESFGEQGHFCSVCTEDYTACFQAAVDGIDTTCDQYVTE